MVDPDRIRAVYSPATDAGKGEVATVSRGVPALDAWRREHRAYERAVADAEKATSPHRNRQGVTVTLASRDDGRLVLARCPLCRRAILHGVLTAGAIVVQCRHCRVPIQVDTPTPGA